MSTRSESRENSPEASNDKRTSKKRKVLSCYACRSRKMKCDRVYPVCGRCQKTGRADQCTYDPRLIEELPMHESNHGDGLVTRPLPDDNAASPSDAVMWKLRIQERRIEALEKKLARSSSAKEAFPVHSSSRFDDFTPEEPSRHDGTMFRGKGFKTQFHGPTSSLSWLATFGELQTFTRETIVSNANFGRIRADFAASRAHRKAVVKEKRLLLHGSDADIYALMPEKSAVDRQAALYFQTCETSHRILHEPTFWKEYQSFFNQTPGQDGNARSASFAAIVVYILAITKCLDPKEEVMFVGDSSADREAALDLIETCDIWLSRQNRKHLTLQYFQLQCLSLLAKRVNNLKCKQDWVASGDLMRLALAAGLHRDPPPLPPGRLTPYDKEMRRRLWSTIVELEVQSSLDSGMQSSACGLFYDVQPPANLPDESFARDTQQMPAGFPMEHFTSTTYQVITSRSLPLRLHLLQLLNNPSADWQYSDVLHYDTQLTSILSTMPTWSDERAVAPMILLELQLRQYLLIMHRPYAKLASTNRRYTYSLTSCIENASLMLASYDKLTSKGNLLLNHVRHDVLRVAATLAQVVFYNCPSTAAHESSPPPEPVAATPGIASKGADVKIPRIPTNDYFTATLCTTAIELLEKARQIYEQKVARIGTGYMEYWLVCAALGMLPAPEPASALSSIMTTQVDDLRSRGKKALERVTARLYRVLSMQKDPESSFATSLRKNMGVPIPTPPVSNIGSETMSSATYEGNALSNIIPGASAMAGALSEGKGVVGEGFGDWQDLQFDMNGWAYPDFWAFDVPNSGF